MAQPDVPGRRQDRAPRSLEVHDAAIERAGTLLAKIGCLIAQRLAAGLATEGTRALRRSAEADLVLLRESRRGLEHRPEAAPLPDGRTS